MIVTEGTALLVKQNLHGFVWCQSIFVVTIVYIHTHNLKLVAVFSYKLVWQSQVEMKHYSAHIYHIWNTVVQNFC